MVNFNSLSRSFVVLVTYRLLLLHIDRRKGRQSGAAAIEKVRNHMLQVLWRYCSWLNFNWKSETFPVTHTPTSTSQREGRQGWFVNFGRSVDNHPFSSTSSCKFITEHGIIEQFNFANKVAASFVIRWGGKGWQINGTRVARLNRFKIVCVLLKLLFN